MLNPFLYATGAVSIEDVEHSQAAENAASTDVPEDMKRFTACTSQCLRRELVETPCGDTYCPECLEKIFSAAMKDETMYPPSCCRITISLRTAKKHTSKGLVRQFKMKQLELRTRNKTYCYRPTCSTFIAPHSIHNGQAICQLCHAVTCSKCRSAWHFGPCSEGDDSTFAELVRSTNWKRCPECRRMIEKMNGCNHME